jgi:DUF4097 and DUF4098 domain-containing protein YvlB
MAATTMLSNLFKSFIAISLIGVFCYAENTENLVENSTELKNEFSVEPDTVIEVENLMGKLTVTSSDSDKVISIVNVHAFKDTENAAKELANKVIVQNTSEDPKKLAILVVYPVGENFLYYYPHSFKGKASSKRSSSFRNRLVYQGKDVTVTNELSPGCSYLFADINLSIPKNAKVSLKNHIGSMDVKDLDADVSFEGMSANINVDGGKGKLLFSNGNGTVTIASRKDGIDGSMGSGKVAISLCGGNVHIDTGSADVNFDECILDNAIVQTGSGDITLTKCEADLAVSTGSGTLRAEDFISKTAFKVETGSGSVRLKGNFSPLQKFLIETGSGSISLQSTPFPNLILAVTTGSGKINIQIPGLDVPRGDIRSFRGSLGTGDLGIGIIRSGSGDVRLNTASKKESSKKDKK